MDPLTPSVVQRFLAGADRTAQDGKLEDARQEIGPFVTLAKSILASLQKAEKAGSVPEMLSELKKARQMAKKLQGDIFDEVV